MKHRCPNCKKAINKVLLEQSRQEKFYPFCCEKCKFIDLGRWLDAKYKIVTDFKDMEPSDNNDENSGQSKRDKG